MSSMAMEHSDISCSPALTDAEGTLSFPNENLCKYPEHSHMHSMLDGMQPVLSSGSNSDKSVIYTCPFPDDDISSLQSSSTTMHSDEVVCASDVVHNFKEPLNNKFTIKPVMFYNSLRDTTTNSDACVINKSADSMQISRQITDLKNSLNDTDPCFSTTRKTKSSGFWKKQSCMVNSYVFEAALDETSLDNTVNKNNKKFTFRRKRRSHTNDNTFSEAFKSQTLSDSSENNESMENTSKVRGKLLGNTLKQNILIEPNIKTRGFKLHKQFRLDEKHFSEAFNDTEITEQEISQDNNKMVKLIERSQAEESLQNCDNFCRAIRNSKPIITSGIFQDVFSESETNINVVFPKDTGLNNNLNNIAGNSLSTVCNEQTTQINEHLESNDCNSFHKKERAEEMFNSEQTTTSIQDRLNNIEGNKLFDHMIRGDLASQSQRNLGSEFCNSVCEKINLKKKIISKAEENECISYNRVKENEEYNEASRITSDVSVTTVENETLKETESDLLLPNPNEDDKICTNSLNTGISQNKIIILIHENATATLQNESSDKENKQNEVNFTKNFDITNRILDISGDMQETSHDALQNIVDEQNFSINKMYHKNYSEDGTNTFKTKKYNQANLNDSEQYKILDTENHNTTNVESEHKHSSNKDSFNLIIQEEHSVIANKMCVHRSPDRGTVSTNGDDLVIHELNCIKTKRKSNLDESNKEVATCPNFEGRKQNIEDNSKITVENTKSVEGTQPHNEIMFSHTARVSNTLTREGLSGSDNNSLINFQSLVYEESEDKIRNEVNDGESVLFEFNASRSLKFCSSSKSSVCSPDRHLSKYNTDLSEVHPDSITRSQITGDSGTSLNSLNNSLMSTTDKDMSENSIDTYETLEMCALNNSLDSNLTENRDPVCDAQDSNSLGQTQNKNTLCIKSTEKYINLKLNDNENNITEQSFTNISGNIINRSKECQKKSVKPSPVVHECAHKSLQKSLSLQTQVNNNESRSFTKGTKRTNTSVLTSNGRLKKQKQSENQENNNKVTKSRKFSNQSKEINNKSITTKSNNNSNESSQRLMVSHLSTNIKHSVPDVLDNMTSDILSENDNKVQIYGITSVHTSFSDYSDKAQLHSKIIDTSTQSQASRNKLKTLSQNNQKQVGSTVKNFGSKHKGRSQNHSNVSIDHAGKNELKQTSKTDKAVITGLRNSIQNLEVSKNSITNMEVGNKTLHDESNDDNGYDVGYNTCASINEDYTPYNEADINKRNCKKKLNVLRKRLFNSSILQNEADTRKFCIPLSELQKRKNKKLFSEENKFAANNSFIDNKFSDGPNVVKNKNNRQFSKYGNWAAKTTKDYLISKLKCKYGVKARWRCHKLVDFIDKKINETITNNNNYNVPVEEIKLELARLNIIETNLDFYMFVLKYLRQYEPNFVFKSVPCIQTFGRSSLVPRPPNGYLTEKIL